MSENKKQKAIALFNFAWLNQSEMKTVLNVVQEYRQEQCVFIGGKYFKKHKYDFEWFVCTVEPTTDYDYVSVLYYHKSKNKHITVLVVKIR